MAIKKENVFTVLKKFPLTKAWAFKCNNQMKGIKIHADFAAININFWITPDKANLNKNTGGLLIWDKEAPKNWDFEKYNNNHLEIKNIILKIKNDYQRTIQGMLEKEERQTLPLKY